MDDGLSWVPYSFFGPFERANREVRWYCQAAGHLFPPKWLIFYYSVSSSPGNAAIFSTQFLGASHLETRPLIAFRVDSPILERASGHRDVVQSLSAVRTASLVSVIPFCWRLISFLTSTRVKAHDKLKEGSFRGFLMSWSFLPFPVFQSVLSTRPSPFGIGSKANAGRIVR